MRKNEGINDLPIGKRIVKSTGRTGITRMGTLHSGLAAPGSRISMSSANESGRGDDHETRLSELDAQGHDHGPGDSRRRTGGGKRGCRRIAAALGPDGKASCRSGPGPGRCGLPGGGGMEPVRPGDVFLRGRAAAVPADRGGRRRIHRRFRRAAWAWMWDAAAGR